MPIQRPPDSLKPPGEALPDYVLVKSKMRGRPARSAVGGRRYPFFKLDEIWYVHKDDVAAHPEMFELVKTEPEVAAAPAPDPVPDKPRRSPFAKPATEPGNGDA